MGLDTSVKTSTICWIFSLWMFTDPVQTPPIKWKAYAHVLLACGGSYPSCPPPLNTIPKGPNPNMIVDLLGFLIVARHFLKSSGLIISKNTFSSKEGKPLPRKMFFYCASVLLCVFFSFKSNRNLILGFPFFKNGANIPSQEYVIDSRPCCDCRANSLEVERTNIYRADSRRNRCCSFLRSARERAWEIGEKRIVHDGIFPWRNLRPKYPFSELIVCSDIPHVIYNAWYSNESNQYTSAFP